MKLGSSENQDSVSGIQHRFSRDLALRGDVSAGRVPSMFEAMDWISGAL